MKQGWEQGEKEIKKVFDDLRMKYRIAHDKAGNQIETAAEAALKGAKAETAATIGLAKQELGKVLQSIFDAKKAFETERFGPSNGTYDVPRLLDRDMTAVFQEVRSHLLAKGYPAEKISQVMPTQK